MIPCAAASNKVPVHVTRDTGTQRRVLQGPFAPELRLKPQIGAEKIMPVHTEYPEWFEKRWGDKLVMAREGSPIQIG
jgi:hypothetical protein